MPPAQTPIDFDAERYVLAAALTSPDALGDTLEGLSGCQFGIRNHQIIFDAIAAVDAAGRPVDRITIADELRRTPGHNLSVETLDALIELSGDIGALGAWIDIVADKALLRDLVVAGRHIIGTSTATDARSETALEEAEQAVFALGRPTRNETFISSARAVADTMRMLSELSNGHMMGLPSGLAPLDRVTRGAQGGQLIIVAGRPGTGKSAFATQIARHMAEVSGQGVAFLSYEMRRDEIMLRLLSQALRYDSRRISSGDIPAGMERDVAVAAEKLAGVPLWIADQPPTTIGGVRSALRRLARRYEVGAVVVDYLQLMSADRQSRDPNRNQEVSEISRGLKQLAVELDVPVIALSQLSRNVENRANKRPALVDLRDSGALEQDANTVIGLYRPSMYDSSASPTEAEILVLKQRSGPSRISIPAQFLDQCTLYVTPHDVDHPLAAGSTSSTFGGRDIF